MPETAWREADGIDRIRGTGCGYDRVRLYRLYHNSYANYDWSRSLDDCPYVYRTWENRSVQTSMYADMEEMYL